MIFISLLTAAILSSGAAAHIEDIHPASSQGRMLTMEETMLGRNLNPAAFLYSAAKDALKEADEEGIVFRSSRSQPRESLQDGSLYWTDSLGVSHPVAISEAPGIVYGTSVSRNEFGINGGCFWSPDGTRLAFYRKDERAVSEFPLLNIKTRTGTLKSIRYPMAGMTSERISLGIYDTSTGETVYVAADDFSPERYLTNVCWGPDGKYIFIQVLDRSQKHCRLNMYRASDGAFVRTILTEDSDKYVEPLDPLYFIGEDYLFIYRTANRDCYRNLYLCDTLGSVRRLAAVDADVAFCALRGRRLFYTSAEVSPVENHLFYLDIYPAKGRKASLAYSAKFSRPVRVTPERGSHRPYISEDGKWMLDTYSSFNHPGSVVLRSIDGKKTLFRRDAPDPLSEYFTGEVEFGTVPCPDDRYRNWYRLFRPAGFDPSKKYPVIVYVYGGPHSQLVTDSWLGGIRLWEMYMAQRGYIVYVQDGRGTENRGLEYEQVIHRFCGKAEMEDQMEGIKYLQSLPYVDSSRIGVHGWSYGGFMTISLITNYPDIFKVAVAGGPVIDWKWYEVMYGERYMETPESNPEGYASTSLIPKAKDLKGKLLICQGAVDFTVVWEHSLSFVQECIDNNVQVDYFPYPVAEHNVSGKNRVHLMDKVSEYFFDWL